MRTRIRVRAIPMGTGWARRSSSRRWIRWGRGRLSSRWRGRRGIGRPTIAAGRGCRFGREAGGIFAGGSAAGPGAVAGAGSDHPVKVIAVGELLVGHRAADGVAHQEHPYLAVAVFGEGTGQTQPVVGAFSAVRRVVENEQAGEERRA